VATGRLDRDETAPNVVVGEPQLAPDDPVLAEPDLTLAEAAAPMTQRRVLGLAIPIIGENLLHTGVSAVDIFMVAQLGAVAVAGVGTAVELVFFIISILSAVSIGATVLVSQAIGAGDREKANQLARQGVAWGLVLAVPVSIGGYLAAPAIISIFGTAPDVAAAATIYFQIIASTTVVLLISFMCGAVLRGAGDSRTPLAAAALANVVNIVAAWVLIFGQFGLPALGVAGSAWAAVLGRGAGAILLLMLLFGGRRAISLRGGTDWLPRLNIAARLFRLGIPAALEQMLLSAGFTSLVIVVAMIGTEALAAQQIAFTALSIALLPGFGFGTAVTALVGQSVGARNIEAAKTAVALGVRWGLVWLILGGVIYLVFARQIIGIFTEDPGVLAAGVPALMVLALSLPATALWTVCAGGMRGSGDTRNPMISSVLAIWLAVALAYVAVRGFGAGLAVVWLMYTITIHFAAIRNWIIVRRSLDTIRFEYP
jgi:putative MATE family efflux protein